MDDEAKTIYAGCFFFITLMVFFLGMCYLKISSRDIPVVVDGVYRIDYEPMDKLLKPCSLCGGTPRFTHDEGHDPIFSWGVECPKCSIGTYHYGTQEETIIIWNLRIDNISEERLRRNGTRRNQQSYRCNYGGSE